MAPDQGVSLHRSTLSARSEQEHRSEQEPGSVEQIAANPGESKRAMFCVLLGSGILQLPIWDFAMTYGIFQEYYHNNWTLEGDRNTTGVIGTTANGVMYIAMPFLFALFSIRWARWWQTAAICGTILACVSFLMSSYSAHVWHLVITQGVTSALGCTLIYSPATLSLGEWFTASNRALAYGVTLSCKNIAGTTCPFLMRALINALWLSHDPEDMGD